MIQLFSTATKSFDLMLPCLAAGATNLESLDDLCRIIRESRWGFGGMACSHKDKTHSVHIAADFTMQMILEWLLLPG